jgi:hypothetical protein
MFQAVIPAVRSIGPVARATGQIVGKTLMYAGMTYSTAVIGAIAVDGVKKVAKFAHKAVLVGRSSVYHQVQNSISGPIAE